MGRTEKAGEGRDSGTDGAGELRREWTEVTTGVEKYAVTRAGPEEDSIHAVHWVGETRKVPLASTAGTGLMTEAEAA